MNKPPDNQEQNMNNLKAVFPLALVRVACRWSAKGVDGRAYETRRPCVVNRPAIDFVRIGDKPIARVVDVSGHARYGRVGRIVYVHTDGTYSFPG